LLKRAKRLYSGYENAQSPSSLSLSRHLSTLPSMLPQSQQPYTQMLSLLRKIDLMRLSLEFKLPTDGSVVNLRDRLRVYLNAHREALFRNPRYSPLFPKTRQPPRRSAPPVIGTPSLSYRTPSPDGSESSNSSTHSYESWHGIEAILPPPDPQPQPRYPPVHPPLVVVPQNPALQFHPPPSPSVPGSDAGSPPPSDIAPGPRKSFSFI
jgi:hypothetical protein